MRSAPTVNMEPPCISKTVIDRNLKFYAHLDRAKYSFSGMKIFPLGACEGRTASSVN